MNTSTPRVLSGPEVRHLSVRSDRQGALRTSLHLAAMVAAGWLVAKSDGWILLPAMLALGIVQVALFAPLHETMHLTAFASRRANAVVGWLASCPSLFNWHHYGVFHLAHHRFTQDPERDPELIVPPPTSLASYLLRVLAVNHWHARLGMIVDCWRGDLSGHRYIPEAARGRVILSVRAMSLLMLAGSVASMILVGWWVPLVFWIGPQLLGQPFLRLYLLTEHTLCSEDANGLTNTRTTLTNAALRLLMWNMSYHAEHHLYPSIPFHRLPATHAAVRDRLAFVQPGYASWHAAYFEKVRRAA